MVSVSEASELIQKHLFRFSCTPVSLLQATGGVLAEPVYADRAFPPFDRVAMDGIAVIFDRLKQGQREFIIEGTQPAGVPQKKLIDPAKCLEVMTGAVLPAGTNTVIRYEDIEISDGRVRLMADKFEQGQNIHKKGQDAAEGQELLKPGVMLSPAEIALLASVGKDTLQVCSLPRIAIISTGDELVEVNSVPAPHQIRRSNSYALYASLSQFGCMPSLHHLPDEATAMEQALNSILAKSDAIILSGGVSKGKFDFVPGVLEKLGVKKVFHQVSQRPGKPFWFGTLAGKIVFALPGNPVSTYLCFYKYIHPWLMESLGVNQKTNTAILAEDFTFLPKLTCFLQVALKIEDGKCTAYPVPGGGSGDFANLTDVDGFLELPLEKSVFRKGEVFPYIPFRYNK